MGAVGAPGALERIGVGLEPGKILGSGPRPQVVEGQRLRQAAQPVQGRGVGLRVSGIAHRQLPPGGHQLLEAREPVLVQGEGEPGDAGIPGQRVDPERRLVGGLHLQRPALPGQVAGAQQPVLLVVLEQIVAGSGQRHQRLQLGVALAVGGGLHRQQQEARLLHLAPGLAGQGQQLVACARLREQQQQPGIS